MLSRRHFLRGLFALSAVPAFTGFYSWQIEPRWVEEVHLTMPIRALPAELVGSQLVQLSDLHIGNRFDWSYMREVFENIQERLPEVVVYTGDFVSYESPEQFEQLSEVIPLLPRGRLGTVAILGNHDYGHGWRLDEVADEITRLLQVAGIQVLRNEVTKVAGLSIVGLDDFWGTRYDPEPLLAGLSSEEPSVVLCHNPDVVDQDVWSNYQGWILAGHTHGGQCKPPFLPPPIVPVQNKLYTAGTFELGDGRSLYINRGLGHLWPVRFNARPEVTVFTLEALVS